MKAVDYGLIMFAAVIVILAGAYTAPRCTPQTPSILIGGALLMAGCR